MTHKKANKKQKSLLDIPPASVGEWNAKIDLITREELYDDETTPRTDSARLEAIIKDNLRRLGYE